MYESLSTTFRPGFQVYKPVPAGVIAAISNEGIDMDFIEQLFGFAPDGGNGLFELLLFVIPIAGLVALAARRKLRSAIKRRR